MRKLAYFLILFIGFSFNSHSQGGLGEDLCSIIKITKNTQLYVSDNYGTTMLFVGEMEKEHIAYRFNSDNICDYISYTIITSEDTISNIINELNENYSLVNEDRWEGKYLGIEIDIFFDWGWNSVPNSHMITFVVRDEK